MEAFERKLEEAQKSLNIPSKDFIPVTFLDETDWAAELISSIPMIAIAGKAIRKHFALPTLDTRHDTSAHSAAKSTHIYLTLILPICARSCFLHVQKGRHRRPEH